MKKSTHIILIIITIIPHFILDTINIVRNIQGSEIDMTNDRGGIADKNINEETLINREKPLDCPFCGAKAELTKHKDSAWISCTNDKCEMRTDVYHYTNLEDAVSKALSVWNKRIN